MCRELLASWLPWHAHLCQMVFINQPVGYASSGAAQWRMFVQPCFSMEAVCRNSSVWQTTVTSHYSRSRFRFSLPYANRMTCTQGFLRLPVMLIAFQTLGTGPRILRLNSHLMLDALFGCSPKILMCASGARMSSGIEVLSLLIPLLTYEKPLFFVRGGSRSHFSFQGGAR